MTRTPYYKAIETKYHGPTDNRGSRIIASDSDGNRVIMSYRSELNGDENHKAAAYALRDKMGWDGELIGGSTKAGMAWVFAPAGYRESSSRE